MDVRAGKAIFKRAGQKNGRPAGRPKNRWKLSVACRMQTEKSLGDELLRPGAWNNCHLPRMAIRAASDCGLARIEK